MNVSVTTPSQNSQQSGFTLIELVMVIFIIGIIAVLMLANVGSQLSKGRDATRKDHLSKYRTALEDYYNDNSCYPPVVALNSCGSSALSPYMPKVLCDQGNNPYRYVPSADCTSYALYTNLDFTADPDIEKVGCSDGCGPGHGYNYGVSNKKLL